MQAQDQQPEQPAAGAQGALEAVPQMDIEGLRAYFAHDEFATKCLGAHLDSFEPGRAVVSMHLDDRHHNAQGFVMGGVVMALCDFALAVVANANQVPGCSVNHSCDIMRRVKGERLIATATCSKQGRSLCFYEINVHDELETHIARMSATVMRTPYVAPSGN